MATKKINIEELEKQYLEAEMHFEAARQQLEQAREEEEAAKQAKLAAEKQKRYDEVIDAYKKFESLKAEYVKDYGYLYWKHAVWF